jgi:hypothetical protein
MNTLRILISLLALSFVACADPVEPEPTTADADPVAIPCESEGLTYQLPPGECWVVEAAPGTIPIGCSDGTGQPQPRESVVGPFPEGGPRAEAVRSFELPGGACYQLVICTSSFEQPALRPCAG